jgi:hypothetical protein
LAGTRIRTLICLASGLMLGVEPLGPGAKIAAVRTVASM